MRDAAPAMAFGLMGGPMQAQGHVQMFLRTQIWKQNPQMAADAPRWRVINGLKVAVETNGNGAALAELEVRGHALVHESPEEAFGFGGAQLVQRIAGGYVAGSDPRKDGMAAGF
jgi:gamma-glutamyltranspeptidase/glutathione hydrolase